MKIIHRNLDGLATAANDFLVASGGGQFAKKTLDEVKTLLNLTSPLNYKGIIDCSGNPNYPAADTGHVYIVSVAGKIGGASGVVVEVGDMALCKVDDSVSGDQATVGANWNIVQTNINGAVTGPASVTDAQSVQFDTTSGKLIKASILTGLIKETSGVPSVATAGTDYRDVVAPLGTTSSATPTPAVGTTGAPIFYRLTALAEGATFGAPTGTPVEGQSLIIRIKDNATAQTLAWNSDAGGYRAGSDVPLPTTTVISKTLYCSFIYNATDSKWDYVGQVGNI